MNLPDTLSAPALVPKASYDKHKPPRNVFTSGLLRQHSARGMHVRDAHRTQLGKLGLQLSKAEVRQCPLQCSVVYS